jgi:hypothetical protein
MFFTMLRNSNMRGRAAKAAVCLACPIVWGVRRFGTYQGEENSMNKKFGWSLLGLLLAVK